MNMRLYTHALSEKSKVLLVLGTLHKNASRIVTPTPSPLFSPHPHRFPSCRLYSTSHISRQIVFTSSCSRVKSSSRQVASVKFVRVKSSASNCHVPTKRTLLPIHQASVVFYCSSCCSHLTNSHEHRPRANAFRNCDCARAVNNIVTQQSHFVIEQR